MSTPTLEQTIAFAVAKYAGHEPDKGGAPYVLHPLRVMLAMRTDEERRVAVLHDVVEDCGVTREELSAHGYPEKEIKAILALTRDKERESYDDFIERLRPNDLARRVKLADLADNMDVRRLPAVDEEARERLDRYLRAWKTLSGGVPECTGAPERASSAPVPARSDRSNTWERFQQDLEKTLGVLQEDHCLVVSAKRTNHFVQFSKGVSEIRAETVSNSFLDAADRLGAAEIEALVQMGWNPPTSTQGERASGGGSPNFHRDFAERISTAEIARIAIRTLVEIFRVPHPDQLEYRAFEWRSSDEILLPALHIKRTQPPPPAPEQNQTYTQVRDLVLRALRDASGDSDLEYDRDGDIAVRFGSAISYVRVNEDPLFVRVYSPVVRNVSMSEGLLHRVNDLNTRAKFVHFLCSDGAVFATLDVFGHPIVPAHVVHACGAVGELADDLDDVLQREFGGRTTFGEFRAAQLKN